MERLNYFNPYQSKGAWHEDQLTRAFLVVARMVPMALAAFLDLIRDGQIAAKSENLLPSSSDLMLKGVEISTQVTAIPKTSGRLVSVLMTDDDWTPEKRIQESQRSARYDGMLLFESEWILVIENKPNRLNVWADQLNPSLPRQGHQIEVDGALVSLKWADVVKRLSGLLEGNWLGSAERLLIDDFLGFVSEHFDYLKPYDTFGQCKGSPERLQKRCESILNGIAPKQVKWAANWYLHYFELAGARQGMEPPAKRCALSPQPRQNPAFIQLAMWPGDTMTQARTLYRYLAEHGAQGLLNLGKQGWEVTPNFHFGFIQKGFGHGVKTAMSVEEYLAYWMLNVGRIEQFAADQRDYESGFLRYAAEGLIAESDVAWLAKEAAALGATNVNVIPGLEVSYRWPLKRAEAIDEDRKGMEEEVKRKVIEAVTAWGGTLVTDLKL